MIFNSTEFLLFFCVVFLLYWFAFSKKLELQNLFLLTSSYLFYGWWSWKFLVLLIINTILDYIYGFFVSTKSRKRAKVFLLLSIINNLGILAIFKYYDFFAIQFKESLSLLNVEVSPVLFNFVLPVGISFYTFHGMSYIFDVYRGKQAVVRSLIDYGVFVSFFPLLVAGPIERANHLLPQIQNKRAFNYVTAVEGCRLILWGLFKKIVIADTLSPLVDNTFKNSSDLDGLSLFIGAVAFSFQIYGDFSGYSDIAIGVSKLLGFELLTNFRFPYFSRDVAEFWRRWHISLSSWFKDYLYIPLGGSRFGKLISVRNTFIIFIVSGFWHGASWNFIVWGGLHGLAFIPLLVSNKNRINIDSVISQSAVFPSLKELIQMLSTFIFITFSWIFFRENSLSKAVSYCWGIFSRTWNFSLKFDYTILALVLIMLSFDWKHRADSRKLFFSNNKKIRIFVYLVLMTLVLTYFFQNDNKSFIYFQF